MKNWPLKWRLSLLLCMVLLSTIVTISIVAYIELEEALLRNIDPTLKAMAEGILANLDKPESLEEREAEFNSITAHTERRYSHRYRVWMDGSNEDLYASDLRSNAYSQLFARLSPVDKPEVGGFTFFNRIQNEYKYRVVWTRHPFNRGVVNILVAGSSRYVYHEMDEFLRLSLILGGSLLLGSFLLVPLIVGWGMRPIDRIAAILRKITHKNVGRKDLKIQKVPRELLPFVEALNGMLARLDKALKQQKQFTADASHELRTPLAVIKSTIQAVRMKDREVADYIKALDETQQDVDRMEQLIEQLLTLARFGESRALPNTTRIALNALLTDLAEIFDARAERQGGEVICGNIPPTWINGNEIALNQLFSNVLDNAVKYGPPNGIINVTLEQGPDGYATICIHDTGGQIPPESLPHLFDRFYRVDSSRSRSTGGAGLGLPIAREIAQRHGGQIDITSEPGKGTSVFIRLPRV